jgi:hypothetical protein
VTASPVLDEDYVLVQIARTLPASDSSWLSTTRLDVVGDIEEGLGPVMGSCRLEQIFGVRTEAGSRIWRDLGQAPDFGRTGSTGGVNDNLAGAVVRLLKNTATGSVTVSANGGTYRFEPFWWGVCRGPTSEPDGESTSQVSGVAGWRCAGIESVTDQVCIALGYARDPTDGSFVRLGFCPPFNANSRGDRSQSTHALPGGTVYIHDLSRAEDAEHYLWTAAQILNHLIAVNLRAWFPGEAAITGWAWTVSDPDGCLAYVPDELNVHGWTVFQAINALASQDRGCTWYVTVSGATATIHIVSTTADAVTFGDVTIPPSSFTAELDLRGDPYIGGCSIVEDWDSVYDIIEVHGARPWRALTLLIDSGFDVVAGPDGGWTTAQETTWDGDEEASGTEHVWRRFTLKVDWNGQQYDQLTEGLRNVLLIGSDGGYSGGREYDSTQDHAPAWMLELTRMLPCSPNFGTGVAGDRQAPVIVSGSEGDWTDRSQSWQLTLSSDGRGSPPAIRIDDGRQGQDIQAIIEAGEQILVSVGVREVDPLVLSWHRPAGERPNATPHRKVQQIPTCEEWTVCTGTVRGVTSDGTDLDPTTVEVEVRDDKPKLEAALALLVAGLGTPHVSVTWNYRGFLDIESTWRTGRLLTTVTQGDRVRTVDSVITRRTWSQVVEKGEGPDAGEVTYWVTSYQTQRLPPRLEAIL